jgi:hypothetical protein
MRYQSLVGFVFRKSSGLTAFGSKTTAATGSSCAAACSSLTTVATS